MTTPEHLRRKAVVVTDVLRATTTIIHAPAAGATMVVPCQEIADKEKRQLR
ncbi:MAG: 2-phosphosulfolactate phosphatase [Pirellulales bacterium]